VHEPQGADPTQVRMLQKALRAAGDGKQQQKKISGTKGDENV
jgi:hypothetical protein